MIHPVSTSLSRAGSTLPGALRKRSEAPSPKAWAVLGGTRGAPVVGVRCSTHRAWVWLCDCRSFTACSDPAFGAAEVGGTARLWGELWCEEHSQVSLLSQEESVPSPSSRIQLHPRARVRLREGRDGEQWEQCLTSWGTPGWFQAQLWEQTLLRAGPETCRYKSMAPQSSDISQGPELSPTEWTWGGGSAESSELCRAPRPGCRALPASGQHHAFLSWQRGI